MKKLTKRKRTPGQLCPHLARRLMFLLLFITSFMAGSGSAWATTTITSGQNYYIQNVSTGLYLCGDNHWGTQGSVAKQGVEFTLTGSSNSYTILNTLVTVTNKYLGTNLYTDSEATQWIIEPVDGKPHVYTISNTAGYLVPSDTDGYITGKVLAQSAEKTAAAEWYILTKEEAIAGLSAATMSAPIDATFLLKNPGFNRNLSTTAWVEGNGCTNRNLSGPDLGKEETNETNRCAESFHSTFSFTQSFTGLPKGIYEVSAQGFYRQDDTDNENLPYIFANDGTSTLSQLDNDDINSMLTAGEAFKTPSNYQVGPAAGEVTDGNLNVGVQLNTNTMLWSIWDNFQMKTYGQQNIIKVLDWSLYNWASHPSISAGAKEETVNGIKFTRSATTADNEYKINDGILTFTNDGNADTGKRYIAIPLENIDGSITVEIASVTGKQLQIKYQFIGGTTTLDSPTSFNITEKTSSGASLSFTISTGKYSNGVLYIGRNGSSQDQIGKVTISTGTPVVEEVAIVKSTVADNETHCPATDAIVLPTIPETAKQALTFEPNARYSITLMNSRLNDFYANTTKMGFGIFSDAGAKTTAEAGTKAELDYVPGLVGKAVLEAVDFYRTNSGANVKPWFYAIQNYADTYPISANGKAGKSFDDLNAVKMYSLLNKFTVNTTFPDGSVNNNASTRTAIENRLAAALKGIRIADRDYSIANNGTSASDGTNKQYGINNPLAEGGWWHKATYDNEMWCDGQYMGPALLAQMINDFESYTQVNTADGKTDWDLITKQFDISWNHLWNSSKSLLYHAFSATPAKDSYWATVDCANDANSKTNSAFWGRADGWYFLALIDVLEQMEKAGVAKSDANYTNLRGKLNTLAAGIAARKDATTGLWYQVLDETSKSLTGNYLESSASAIFLTSFMKGKRLGLIDTDYTELIKTGYKNFVENFLVSDGNGGIHIWGSSRSAGLSDTRKGDNAYYLDQSGDAKMVTVDEQVTEGKVLGAFIMAAVEYERLYLEEPTVESVAIEPANVYVDYRGKRDLTATVLPSTANQNVVWTSSNPSVATIEANGTVTGKAMYGGAAVITATSVADDTKTASCNVYCYRFTPKGGNANNFTFVKGGTGVAQLLFYFPDETPFSITEEDFTITSSDKNVMNATVRNISGNLLRLDLQAGQNAGTATLTITYDGENENYKGKSCIVNYTVKPCAYDHTDPTIGAEDQSTGFWGAATEPVAIVKGQTKSFTFNNHGNTAQNWNNWNIAISSSSNLTSEHTNEANKLILRADNFVLLPRTETDADVASQSFYLKDVATPPANEEEWNNFWTQFRTDMQNSAVTATVTYNSDNTVSIRMESAGGSNTYVSEVTSNAMDEGMKYIYFVVDNSHITNFSIVGQAVTPALVVSDNISYQTETAKTASTSVQYQGNDVSEGFIFTYTLENEDLGTVSGDGKQFTFTPKIGVTEGSVLLTITATPDEAYKDQYTPVTKTITLTIVNNALDVTAVVSSTSVNVGELVTFNSITVTDKNSGSALDDYTLEYQSSAPSVLSIDQAGNMIALSDGTTTIKIIARKDEYASAAWTQVITVIDPTVFNATQLASTPSLGQEITSVPDITATFGGWIFVKGVKGVKNSSNGFAANNWGDIKHDDAGSLPNFQKAVLGGDLDNPLDEKGANCAPEGTTVDFTDGYTMIDKMFCAPADGAYMTFAPKTNGIVTAHILQNGVLDNSGATVEKQKPTYNKNRRVFVIDETGTRIPDEQITAHLDVTTGKMPKYNLNKGDANYQQPIRDISMYTDKSTPIASVAEFNTKLSADFMNIDGTSKTFSFTAEEETNGTVVADFQNALYRRICNSENDGLVGGYVVLAKAPVTYTFPVKAGKTYYLYTFGSRMGFFGFDFKPSDDVTIDAPVALKETQNNSISKTAEGHMVSVSLDRKFTPGVWNSCVLPFSLNKQQVDAIFGHTYDNQHEDGTQILYFEKVEGSTIYYTRHAYNTLVAGKPFLIKPSGKDVELVDDKIVLNTAKVADFPYVTIEQNTKPADWGRVGSGDYIWTSDYNVQTIVPNDYYINGNGELIMREVKDAKVQAFRGYLKKREGGLARSLSVAMYSMFEDSDDATPIEDLMVNEDGEFVEGPTSGIIYNLQGQVVSTDAKSLFSLPKGIYIVNGKKYNVK